MVELRYFAVVEVVSWQEGGHQLVEVVLHAVEEVVLLWVELVPLYCT